MSIQPKLFLVLLAISASLTADDMPQVLGSLALPMEFNYINKTQGKDNTPVSNTYFSTEFEMSHVSPSIESDSVFASMAVDPNSDQIIVGQKTSSDATSWGIKCQVNYNPSGEPVDEGPGCQFLGSTKPTFKDQTFYNF